jgi:hypothetical protein
VTEEVTKRDRIHKPVGVVNRVSFRNIANYRVIETEQALIPELHDRHGGEGLGNRGPMVYGILIDRAPGLEVGESMVIDLHYLAIVDQRDGGTNDPGAPEGTLVVGDERAPGPLEGWWPLRMQGSDGGGEERRREERVSEKLWPATPEIR